MPTIRNRPTSAYRLRRAVLLLPVPVALFAASRLTSVSAETSVASPTVPETVAATSTLPTAPASTTSTTTTTLVSTTTSTTTTLLPGDWACPAAVTLAAQLGWPADELDTLDAIIWRESRCDPSARSVTHDTGLTQINDFWCRSTAAYPAGFLQTAGLVDTCADLFDPETSLRASLVIWQRSGWAPWGG